MKTIFRDSNRIKLSLPICVELKDFHDIPTIPFLADPFQMKKSLIVAMFVLRPWLSEHFLPRHSGYIESLYSVKTGWAYNYSCKPGGKFISESNSVDSYRMALKYGCSDAVMFGSKLVSSEGCDALASQNCQQLDSTEAVVDSPRQGYLWQSYEICNWPHMKRDYPGLEQKIEKQRELWQSLGILSMRRYPAQIVLTWSGSHFSESRDFLEGRIFHECHPNGDPMEVYIITSKSGAARIRSRASEFNLHNRIESMLIVLSPSENADEIDVEKIPKILFEKYGIFVINHDGGKEVLRKFVKAGVIHQFDITICRDRSLFEVIQQQSHSFIPAEIVRRDVDMFFTEDSQGISSIPLNFKTAAAEVSENMNVAVVTFDPSEISDF